MEKEEILIKLLMEANENIRSARLKVSWENSSAELNTIFAELDLASREIKTVITNLKK